MNERFHRSQSGQGAEVVDDLFKLLEDPDITDFVQALPGASEQLIIVNLVAAEGDTRQIAGVPVLGFSPTAGDELDGRK